MNPSKGPEDSVNRYYITAQLWLWNHDHHYQQLYM